MNRIEILTKLLSDAQFRAAFLQDRNLFLDRLDVSKEDREMLLAVSAKQVEQQAMTLQKKRFREVRKLIPESMSLNHQHFENYAAQSWPEGHGKHVSDAAEFLDWLRKRGFRICLREYWRLRTAHFQLSWFVDTGMLSTPRGWRPAIATRLPWFGRCYDVLVTLG